MNAVLGSLRQRWPDALRSVASGLLAYALSALVLHLPESMWAVLTALIVSRPDTQGAFAASVGRLAATVFGAALAVVVAFGHAYRIPEIALLAAVLIPTCLLAAINRNYSTAPVAALIVISSGTIGGSAVTTAIARTIEIALGAIVSVLVTVALRPRSADSGLVRVLELLPRLDNLMAYVAGKSARSAEKWRQLQTELRAELRDVAATAASAARREDRERVQGVLRLVSALQSDVLLIAHAQKKMAKRPDLSRIAEAFGAATATLPALVRSGSGAAAQEAANAAAAAFAATAEETAAATGPDSVLWSVLLGHLAEDVARLAGVLSGTPAAAAG